MLGQAKQIRTANLEARYNPGAVNRNLGSAINKWCEENKDTEIIDIKFSAYGFDAEYCYHCALIIYKI